MTVFQFYKQNPLVQLIINLLAVGIKGERENINSLATYKSTREERW